MNKLVRPKLVLVVLDKLDECDQKTPWMRSVNDQSLQQNPEENKRIRHFVTMLRVQSLVDSDSRGSNVSN